MLCCLTAANPTSWSDHLHIVEYAHNAQLKLQRHDLYVALPLFPRLPAAAVCSREDGDRCPSVQAHILRCQRIWYKTWAAML